MDSFIKLIGIVAYFIISTVFIGLLLSLPVMLLWNACLVPAIPGLLQIGWLQAWGILILCGTLFKSSSSNQSK